MAYGLWQCGTGFVEGGRKSDTFVAEFHRNMNAGKFDDIYNQSDAAFRQSSTKEDLLKFLAAVHNKLGTAGSTSRAGINVNTNTNGTFVTVTYTTQYDKGTAAETFTWRKGVTGDLKLVGYDIRSNALIVQ